MSRQNASKPKRSSKLQSNKKVIDAPQAQTKNHPFHIEFLNQAQKLAWAAFDQHDVLFLLGCPGTGKTHLACSFAISEVLAKRKKKIILTRPIVEAGEALGFLPGTFDEKVSPYMTPMYDAITKCVGIEGPQKDIIGRSTEVAPIAYMRGRSQPLDAKILTPNGYVTMGSIKEGDFVIGSDGTPTKVEKIYPQGELDVFKITFTDRTSVECSADHLWDTTTLYERRHKKAASTKTTAEIASSIKYKHQIPISCPVNFSEKILEVDPYSFGTNEKKFIPEKYMQGSVCQRFELLRGLMDTNGHCFRKYEKLKVCYYSFSEKLASDVASLVCSLGGTAFVKHYKNENLHVVNIRMLENPFKLNKKANKFVPLKPIRSIINIEKVGRKECQCIRVDAKDSLYLTDHCIVTHNTFDDAICIFDEAQNATVAQLKLFMTRFGKNSKIIITGDPEQSDLRPQDRGLMHVIDKLKDLNGIGIIEFGANSIVRHPLIGEILKRLETK